MCGKASVSHLRWKDIYGWATSLTPPATWPDDPANRINVSPSRLRRKSEPDSMVWESLPAIVNDGRQQWPLHATWPYLPGWSRGRLPTLANGRLLSTANARLRHESQPFAPTFMHAWRHHRRAVAWVSWFYEFDSRVKPQVPYSVFPLDLPFWPMAALASPPGAAAERRDWSVAIITVDPNQVLQSVGHHRSPALLRDPGEVQQWLQGDDQEALELLRPYPDDSMGVEPVPMGIKIPGNENIELPEVLARRNPDHQAGSAG